MQGFWRQTIWLAAAILCAAVGNAALADILVKTQHEYTAAARNLRPGDTIVLANGEWRDFEIILTGQGTAKRPIELTAQTPGKVLITGQSNLRLAGEYLVVSGLVFTDGYSPTNTVVAFRRNQQHLANNSRVTGIVIDRFNNPERFETDFWVMMYGKNNRFDHNHLEGKSNQGVTMAVRLDSTASQQNHHRIDHNYFGPRPVLGSNGGETLRIGTSKYSLSDSFTVVENNYFDRCNGEVEIISNKSGHNVFRGNIFNESRGTLTLRHGNDNLVENNVFLGNHVDHTGGIRVINKRQTIRNNYLHGLTGHRFGGALVVMNGVPDSPINRYHQVEGSIIERNSIIDSRHIELAAGSDEERSAPPVNTVFRHNLIYNQDGSNVIAVHDDVGGIDFADNILNDVAKPVITRGFRSERVTLERADNGLFYPAGIDAGADRSLKVLKRSDTGVSWYPKPGPDQRFDSGATTIVPADGVALVAAVEAAKAGDILALQPGKYVVAKTLLIKRPITLRAHDTSRRPSIEFERSALFEIIDGGSLKLAGLNISGDSAPDAAGNTLVRTSRYSMLSNYALIIQDSTFSNLNTNHSFNFFTTARHTFADSIVIMDSEFRNITGHVLAMSRESDDLGIYNGEYVSIVRSHFRDIGGTVADIYRGGTDESTFGPHFELSESTLENVGRNKRNKTKASLRLLGVQATDIHDNVFIDSQPIHVTQTVGEPVTRLADNTYRETAEPIIDGSGNH